ncbi:MAG: APC family permease [Pseudolysinimonas sp.]
MTSTETKSEAAPARLTGNLGAVTITFMVIAAAAPLTVVGGLMPIGYLLHGEGFPAMFLVATVILLLFAVGLVAMSRHVPDAGAFFTYISHGLGRVSGVSAAYLALICYTFVQCAVVSFLGASISGDIALLGGPEIPWWVFTLIAVAIFGFLGYRHIELSSRVLVVVLALEMAVVLVLTIAVVIHNGAEGLSLNSFTFGKILEGSPALGLMLAIASFIGFESAVVFRSEVRDPNRTIARGTYGSAIIIGVFYAIAGWGLLMGIGPSKVVDFVLEDPSTALARVTDIYLGPVGGVIIAVLFLGSMFAAVLSLHNVIARYQFAMGRAGLLPRRLGTVHPTHGSPAVGSLVQTATAVLLVLIVLVTGIGPANAFAWFAGIGGLAIAILYAGTCLAVIVFFQKNKVESNLFRTIIAPALGFIGLVVSGFLIAQNFPLLVNDVDADGNPVFGVVSIVLLLIIAAGPVIGIVQGLIVRARSPQVYADITKHLDED